MSDDIKTSKQALLDVADAAVAQEALLRERYGIGEKFRFIRDRLQTLQSNLKQELAAIKETAGGAIENVLTDNEVVVYVYLFNAQGASVPTWKKMVHPSVLYEYSVNRPIYEAETAIQTVIRDKANRQQHAYLAIAVQKAHILTMADDAPKDAYGQPLIRVKEGALQIERVIFLKHNGNEYRLNEAGELVKVNV